VNGTSLSSFKSSASIKGDCAVVWIPQSGTKYHSRSSCSNMVNPRRVTLHEATSQGYTACKRCH